MRKMFCWFVIQLRRSLLPDHSDKEIDLVFSSLKNRHFVLIDLLLLSLTPAIALSLRLQIPWDPLYTKPLLIYTFLSVIVKIVVFYFAGIYRQFWRYASIDSMITILWGVGASSVIITGIVFSLYGSGYLGSPSIPRSIPLIDGMLTMLVIGGTRLGLRVIEYQSGGGHTNPEGKRVLLAGAGDAGQIVAREIHQSKFVQDNLIGFVDDDPVKKGTMIHGVTVLGGIADIPEIAEKNDIDEVIIAMPTAPGSVIREVVRLCESSDVSVKTLPGIFELISGEVSVNRLREVQIGDLLRRDPVVVQSTRVKDLIAGKRVLVTGAGGSIGSELCEQIVQCDPAQLIALGHGENSLYKLPAKLSLWTRQEKKERLELVIADIRDQSRIDQIFSRYKPDIVYHAAAHKHVPLMEDNIEDAITNNIEGTRILTKLCKIHGINHFVLISTDKAVEPSSVMGMTKRVAELIVREAAHDSGRAYVSVRFGNVLGSRGSVVPLFQDQIAAGGPITITDPDMERFFMTIQEAVQLVLQASAMGSNGELFVLDMGDQVKIVDLARDLIQLSGLTVGDDIEIKFTGLRPGEKLSERLFSDQEKPVRSRHEKILVIEKDSTAKDPDLDAKLDLLIQSAKDGEREKALSLLSDLV